MAATLFLNNPDLKTIKPDYPGNKLVNGQFANGDVVWSPDFYKVLKWRLSKNPQREEKKNDKSLPAVIFTDTFFDAKEDMIVWLGHASFFIRLNGTTFLTDPVLFAPPMLTRLVPLPFRPDQIRNIDFILYSHGHYDHLDKKSLQIICKNNPDVKVLAPLKMQQLLQKYAPGVTVQEAGWYQQFSLTSGTGVDVFFMPASHWFKRGLTDTNKILWGSFVLKNTKTNIYFAGDTSFNLDFKETRKLFGEPDFALMPIGAYKPAFLMKDNHMNPEEAVEAFNLLGGKNFIPMHYGTFNLSDEPISEPIRLINQFAAAGKLKGRLHLPAIGEAVLI